MDWVAQARALATEAHASQRDKAGRPCIEHVARVAAAIHDDDAAKAAAWLHDVVEDCPQFADRVRDFPQPIHDAVTLLSRQSAPDAAHYYANIRQHPLALKVKLADIADNADPQRLRLLDPELAGRLQEKYSAALAELGERRSPQKTGSPASPQQRLQQMMEAARTLEQLVRATTGRSSTDCDLPAHQAALIKARDLVFAELEAQMEPEAFMIWRTMHSRT